MTWTTTVDAFSGVLLGWDGCWFYKTTVGKRMTLRSGIIFQGMNIPVAKPFKPFAPCKYATICQHRAGTVPMLAVPAQYRPGAGV